MTKIYQTRSPARIFVALGILLAGLLLLIKNTLAVSPPPAPQAHHETSAEVEQALNPARFDVRPTLNQLPDIYEQVELQVVAQAQRIAAVRRHGDECAVDLGYAFVERLRFMLSPEPRRDYEAISARGDPRNYRAWADRFKGHFAARETREQLPAMDISGVEVSQVSENHEGVQTARAERFSMGFGITTGKGIQFDEVSGDPVSDGMLVIEVVIPMERQEMKSGEYVEAVQGYHFAWNPRVKKWIPYESVIYKQSGNAFVPPPL